MSKHAPWIVIVLAAIAVIAGIFWYSSRPSPYVGFAECIAQSGATFYGAFWCPHCQAQKAEFGSAADKLPYVECSTPDGSAETDACKAAGVEGYPTWQFKDGSRQTGALSLEDLASSTGCALPNASAK